MSGANIVRLRICSPVPRVQLEELPHRQRSAIVDHQLAAIRRGDEVVAEEGHTAAELVR
jgi:hypothetical protein